MNNPHDKQHRAHLQRIAQRVMLEKGLLPEFSSQALSELDAIDGPAIKGNDSTQDLRNLLWCSIDNDDSHDLDQLTVAESLPDDKIRIFVAVADVDALVKKQSAIDDHASHNTTSIYTAGEIFPMLPEKLSTDLTSLNLDSDRASIVIEMVIAGDGTLLSSSVCKAIVRNKAKLAYNSVAAWLEENEAMPEAIAGVKGLEENIRLQIEAAKRLKALRHKNGALELETIEARPVFEGEEITDLKAEKSNVATELIEDFMICANGVTARYLAGKELPSLRRVVRVPKRWERIVALAAEHNFTLPKEPDSKALDEFLLSAKAAAPLLFPDISLSVIKLLGPGEYVVELPGENTPGHFGLAVKDYAHSTAPNRRFPDLITQRLIKAALEGKPQPYTADELETLAKHCTEAEDTVKKVERLVGKSAAAMLLESRIKQKFDAFVTGASVKGTWVRLLDPPVEGRLMSGFEGMDVGNRVRVQLMHTNIERGFIDFKKIN